MTGEGSDCREDEKHGAEWVVRRGRSELRPWLFVEWRSAMQSNPRVIGVARREQEG